MTGSLILTVVNPAREKAIRIAIASHGPTPQRALIRVKTFTIRLPAPADETNAYDSPLMNYSMHSKSNCKPTAANNLKLITQSKQHQRLNKSLVVYQRNRVKQSNRLEVWKTRAPLAMYRHESTKPSHDTKRYLIQAASSLWFVS